jgi:dTDP-4-amino-4,6-dideoxygalactose transaminase
LVDEDFAISRDELYEQFKSHNVYTRRYFYPLISSFSMYRHFASALVEHLPVANQIAAKILCLPIFPDLTEDEQSKIIKLINQYSLKFRTSDVSNII